MELKKKDKKNSLFLSICKTWKGDGYVFTFPKQFEEETNYTMHGFGTYMLKTHGDAVLLCLTAEAGERALNSTWNEEKGCAVSADDKELEEINKKDNMTWLIETKEEKGELSKEDKNMANFQFF